MQLREISNQVAWDNFVTTHPWGHPLQLWGWGEGKRATKWTPYRLALMDGERIIACAQLLLWPIPRTGRFIAYVPRGPVAEPGSPEMEQMLAQLVAWAADHKAVYVRLEPAWTAAMLPKGWRPASNTIQLPATYTIDLTGDEATILEPMARKHRQYIRKAERDGVSVVRETDGNIGPMYELYLDTAKRAGFGIHPRGYYERLAAELGQQNYLYYALSGDQPVAFLWLAAAGPVAYELYGGVSQSGQDVKANYFLKWHAITQMKAAGYKIYDFNGRLNEGVAQFKVGFGPNETDYIGAYDYVLNEVGYKLWERLWPLAKPVGRFLKSVKR